MNIYIYIYEYMIYHIVSPHCGHVCDILLPFMDWCEGQVTGTPYILCRKRNIKHGFLKIFP